MELNLNAETINAASTPEEFALIFKQAATAALAIAIRDGLQNAMSAVELQGNPNIDGWKAFIGGLHAEISWAKPAKEIRPLSQITAFTKCDYADADGWSNLVGVNVEVGISIKGTF
ncbi:hypothetical protein [Rubellimicrobium aerolatum]|uniref:Uncharacterized protein n=1 Tax=Rubellimicrobium aerolatum TaxID=490979 RepID=A0ABW0SEC2_9RHOB|nr:hypothetical protein [Rubellimicrobium aerolatum]MBP1805691.1 hypothetical protein [Rubellimicrobium aerolatum]